MASGPGTHPYGVPDVGRTRYLRHARWRMLQHRPRYDVVDAYSLTQARQVNRAPVAEYSLAMI